MGQKVALSNNISGSRPMKYSENRNSYSCEPLFGPSYLCALAVYRFIVCSRRPEKNSFAVRFAARELACGKYVAFQIYASIK